MEELKLKEIQPLTNQILTTANKYDEAVKSKGGIILVDKLEKATKLYQTVLAVGPLVRNIKVGDVIMINPIRYYNPKTVQKQEQDEQSLRSIVRVGKEYMDVVFPVIEIDGEERLLLYENDADFIIKSYTIE